MALPAVVVVPFVLGMCVVSILRRDTRKQSNPRSCTLSGGHTERSKTKEIHARRIAIDQRFRRPTFLLLLLVSSL